MASPKAKVAAPKSPAKNFSTGRSVRDDRATNANIRAFQSRVKNPKAPSRSAASSPPKAAGAKPVFGMSGAGIQGAMRSGSMSARQNPLKRR